MATLKLTEKTITRIHKRIMYWSQFPFMCTNLNPLKNIVNGPDFENWYKNEIMKSIIEDWQIKNVEDFTEKFNTIWEMKLNGDYTILAKNFCKKIGILK